jgi:hypothetical protein
MATSDLIARFILDALDHQGYAELQRASLAEQFSCVPSQINYVLSTRFSPEHGYVIESRRGGGGYIRIRRVQPSPGQLIMHMVKPWATAWTPERRRPSSPTPCPRGPSPGERQPDPGRHGEQRAATRAGAISRHRACRHLQANADHDHI